MNIKIKKIDANAVIPKYQSKEAAGFDLHSVESITLKSGEYRAVKIGITLEIENGYELQIRPRSGMALKHGISVLNTPGTIDSDYRGEIMVILVNHSKTDFLISIGDRIAQGVVNKVYNANFEEVEHLSSSERGALGFGSSGIK